jgi:hypothetical protein
LTNYSVQKYNENFAKFEEGNEVSFKIFQDYLKETYPNKGYNILDLYKQINEVIKLTMFAVKDKINIFNRSHCFELFGYDFILDNEFNPYLLEINTNPGLEESSTLIKELVPRLIEDAIKLTVDDIFPSFTNNTQSYESPYPVSGYTNEENMWQLICNLREADEYNTLDNRNLKQSIKLK